MSMLKKLTDLAKSEKGKEFAEKATAKAKQIANDPETREKFDAAKKKLTDRVSGAGDKPAAQAAKTTVDGPDEAARATAADSTTRGPADAADGPGAAPADGPGADNAA